MELFKVLFDGKSAEMVIEPSIYSMMSEKDKKKMEKITRKILQLNKDVVERNGR